MRYSKSILLIGALMIAVESVAQGVLYFPTLPRGSSLTLPVLDLPPAGNASTFRADFMSEGSVGTIARGGFASSLVYVGSQLTTNGKLFVSLNTPVYDVIVDFGLVHFPGRLDFHSAAGSATAYTPEAQNFATLAFHSDVAFEKFELQGFFDYKGDLSPSGYSIGNLLLTPVPEPTPLRLLLLALCLGGIWRSRKCISELA